MDTRPTEQVRLAVERALVELGARWDEDAERFCVETPHGMLEMRIGQWAGLIACIYDDPDRAHASGVVKSNGKHTVLFDEHDPARAAAQVTEGIEWRVFGFEGAKARRAARAVPQAADARSR